MRNGELGHIVNRLFKRFKLLEPTVNIDTFMTEHINEAIVQHIARLDQARLIDAANKS